METIKVDILQSKTSDTIIIKNRLKLKGGADGIIPLGAVIGVAPFFTGPNNTGTIYVPKGIPASGQISANGMMRGNGVIIPEGADVDLVGKYTCDLSDERFLMGASGISTDVISVVNGVNNGDNTVSLTEEYNGPHDHGGSTVGNVDLDHTHPYNKNDDIGDNSLVGIGARIELISGPIESATGSSGPLNHNHDIAYSGSGLPIDIKPKFMKVIYLQQVRL